MIKRAKETSRRDSYTMYRTIAISDWLYRTTSYRSASRSSTRSARLHQLLHQLEIALTCAAD
eukprot:scaffold86665_cov24-Prasinocladus_malaysianus.AAC.1